MQQYQASSQVHQAYTNSANITKEEKHICCDVPRSGQTDVIAEIVIDLHIHLYLHIRKCK